MATEKDFKVKNGIQVGNGLINATNGDVSLRRGMSSTNRIRITSGNIINDTNTIISGNLEVTGNFNIAGDVNQTSVTTLDVTDKTITVANNAGSAANANGAGIIVDTGTNNPHMIYTSATDEWDFNRSIDINGGSGTGLKIHSGGAIVGAKSGGDTQLMYWGGGPVYYGRSSLGGTVTGHEFRVGGTTKLNVDSSGDTVVSGNLKLTANDFLYTSGTNFDIKHTGSSQNITFHTTTSGGATSEIVRFTHNKRVGIGIASPDAPLHIEDSTSSAYGGLRVVGAGTGSGSTNVRQIADFGRTNSGSVSGVWLGGRTDETTAVIGAKTASGNIAFEVYQSGWKERMRIKNDGKVGIGQATPLATLHVGGGTGSLNTTAELFVPNNDALMRAIKLGHGASTANITTDDSSKPITFTAGGSEKMRVEDDGKVGIGTTSPAAKLEVKASNSSSADWANKGIMSSVQINAANRTFGGLTMVDHGSGSGHAGLGFRYDGTGYKLELGTASSTSSGISTHLTIDRLGAIVTSGHLTVAGDLMAGNVLSTHGHPNADDFIVGNISGSATGLTIVGASGSSGNIHFSDGTSSGNANIQGQLVYAHNDNSFRFYTAVTEKMRITSTGNVGIGTTAPQGILHVAQSKTSGGDLWTAIGAGNAAALHIQNTGNAANTNAVLYFRNSSAEKASIGARFVNQSTGETELRFSTTNSSGTSRERMRLDGDGKLGIGFTDPSGSLHVTAKDNSGSDVFIVAQNTTNNRISGYKILDEGGNIQGLWRYDNGGNYASLSVGTAAAPTTITLGESSTGISFTSTATSFNSGKVATIRGETTGTGHGNLAFDTFQGGSGGGERMVILSNGNVGIGTSSPTRTLHVNGQAQLENNLVLNENTPAIVIPNGDLRLFTGGAESMRLDSNGNVGIAKTSLTTWSSGYNALQIGGRGFVGAHSGSDLYVGQNASFNSGWKYQTSVAASLTQHSGGKITQFVAPAGTAGNAISWNTAIDINPTGEVAIGLTPSSGIALKIGNAANNSAITRVTNGTVHVDLTASSSGKAFLEVGTNHPLVFATNATERMRIDSAGNVGVGVTSIPSWANLMTSGTVAVGGILYIKQDQKIQGLTAFPGGAGNLSLNPDGGKVGIGTSSPSSALHIQTNDGTTNSAVNSLMITNLSTGTTTTGFGGEIRFQAERNNGVNQNTGGIRSIAEVNSGTNISSGLAFDTSAAGVNTEKLRISYDGKIGIGTTSPDHPLEVVGVISSADSGLQKSTFENAGNNLVITANKGQTNVSSNIIFKSSQSGSTSAERMRIDNLGNVGINTSNAYAGTGVTSMTVNAANYPVVSLKRADSHIFQIFGYYNHATLNASVGWMQFDAGSAERMRIDSSGKVGIGTSAPGSLLTIYNNSTSGNTVLHVHNDKTGDAAVLRLEGKRTSTNDTGQIIFANNGSVGSTIRAYSNGDNGDMRFYTSASGTGNTTSEALRITTAGDISVISGKGLYFGGSNRSTSTNSQAYIRESGLNLDIKGNDNVRLLGDGGNIILHADYTGRVGIGTTSPKSALHVQGDIGQQGTTDKSVSSGVVDSGVNIITGVHASYARGSGRLRVMGTENNLNVGYAEYMYTYSISSTGHYYINLKFIDESYVNNTYARPRLYLYNSSTYNNNATNRQNTNQSANSSNSNIGQIGITNVANQYGTFQIVAEPMHWKP